MEAGRYTDIELSAFLTACAAAGISLDEVVG
jgi:thymidine phosphorylase